MMLGEQESQFRRREEMEKNEVRSKSE